MENEKNDELLETEESESSAIETESAPLESTSSDDEQESMGTVTGKSRISANSAVRRNMSNRERTANRLTTETAAEQIRTDIYRKTIRRNVIASVQTLTVKGMRAVCVSFPLSDEARNIRVAIPFEQVFWEDPVADSYYDNARISAEGRARLEEKQRSFLDSMLGAVVRWIPMAIITDEESGAYTVIASRKAAMEIDRENYYLSENAHIQNDHCYRARVLFVAPHSMMVVLGGVECMISHLSATNRYLTDLRDYFSPGSVVPVAVRRLNTDTKTKKIDVVFDLLSGELIEAQERIKGVRNGDIVIAKISKVIPARNPEGEVRTRIFAWIEGYDVPATVSLPRNRFGLPITQGDSALVQVTGVDDNGYVKCYIRSVFKTAGL